jgi:soluble lytic murein transglycosylase-like protein
MRRGILISIFALLALLPVTARADYAVLRSGARLHITSYERNGDSIHLVIDGGTADVPADSVVNIEPEDFFPANPAELRSAISSHYGSMVRASARRHGVDEYLILSVIEAESNFNPHAVSRRNAQGLMQLVPATAARYSVANIFDPAQNIEAGTHYLKDLLGQFHGNVRLALAAYNAGPDMVTRYGGIPPFPETRAYVRRITAEYEKETNRASLVVTP